MVRLAEKIHYDYRLLFPEKYSFCIPVYAIFPNSDSQCHRKQTCQIKFPTFQDTMNTGRLCNLGIFCMCVLAPSCKTECFLNCPLEEKNHFTQTLNTQTLARCVKLGVQQVLSNCPWDFLLIYFSFVSVGVIKWPDKKYPKKHDRKSYRGRSFRQSSPHIRERPQADRKWSHALMHECLLHLLF